MRFASRHNDRYRQRHGQWSLAELEPRLMLAADVGAEMTSADVAHSEPSGKDACDLKSAARGIVFVDPNVSDLSTFIAAVDSQHDLVLLNANRSGIEQISDVLSTRANVASVHIIAHGEAGKLAIGNDMLDMQAMNGQAATIRGWARSLTDEADILLYGCRTGEGEIGRNFVVRLAQLTGADVAASIDATGNAAQGGDWELERVVGTLETGLALDSDARERYRGVLPIAIYAAGSENDEQMLLQIDGNTVATFDDVGGNAGAGVFETYTYDADGITPDQVRIVFTNDLWDPANGIDRNLRVDKIVLDGTTYETEDPSVFSTGTWLPEDGVQPGFRESELLHAAGYFQYAGDDSGNQGSLVEIRARGSEGTELFDLKIDQQFAGNFAVTTDFQTFTYTAAELLTADQIRIQFLNDQWDPANQIDANLIVDWIQIDGARVETESPFVFSTGTYRPADGIQPGYGRGDILHVNGYFQYDIDDSGNNDGSLIEIRAAGDEGSELFNLQIDNQVVANFAASTDFQTYSYTAADVVTADQIRVEFLNDQWDPVNEIDANLKVDWIEVDGVRFETEGPDVFSTGTYLPADGIQPGFGRGQTLHASGYFQYADSQPPLNDPPVAADDSFTTAEELAINLAVLDNDSDINDDPLTVTQINGTAVNSGDSVAVVGGAAGLNADGTITFTPSVDFNGAVLFPYTISDGALSATATVTGTVTPISDPPLAADDNFNYAVDSAVDITVLGNDSDGDGDALTISEIDGISVTVGDSVVFTGGGAALNLDGTITFTPDAGFSDPVSFSYTISDGESNSTATVTGSLAPIDGEVWRLESAAFAGQYLRLEQVGGNVSLSAIADARSMWQVTNAGAGTILQNVATGQYLDADGIAAGGNVDVSSLIESDDYWTIVDSGAAGLTLQNADTGGFIDADALAEGGNVDQSVLVAADDYWLKTIVETPDSRALPDATEITFAAFGDYGVSTPEAALLSSLVHQLEADIIVTMGDGRYGNTETYAGVHGGLYSYYLSGAQPSDDAPTGGTSSINRFFPAPGNHDYDDAGGITEYLDYFSLPGDGVPTASSTGSELFYDVVWGPAHFFVIDSEAFQNSPASQMTQSTWLQSQLEASTAAWQIVVMHHAPFSSGDDHGSNLTMQLPYADWGADLVLSGHDHTYERLQRDGLTYVVSGLGGKSIYGFDQIEVGSLVRYNDDFGASFFTVSETQLAGSFVSIDGVTQDSFVINAV